MALVRVSLEDDSKWERPGSNRFYPYTPGTDEKCQTLEFICKSKNKQYHVSSASGLLEYPVALVSESFRQKQLIDTGLLPQVVQLRSVHIGHYSGQNVVGVSSLNYEFVSLEFIPQLYDELKRKLRDYKHKGYSHPGIVKFIDQEFFEIEFDEVKKKDFIIAVKNAKHAVGAMMQHGKLVRMLGIYYSTNHEYSQYIGSNIPIQNATNGFFTHDYYKPLDDYLEAHEASTIAIQELVRIVGCSKEECCWKMEDDHKCTDCCKESDTICLYAPHPYLDLYREYQYKIILAVRADEGLKQINAAMENITSTGGVKDDFDIIDKLIGTNYLKLIVDRYLIKDVTTKKITEAWEAMQSIRQRHIIKSNTEHFIEEKMPRLTTDNSLLIDFLNAWESAVFENIPIDYFMHTEIIKEVKMSKLKKSTTIWKKIEEEWCESHALDNSTINNEYVIMTEEPVEFVKIIKTPEEIDARNKSFLDQPVRKKKSKKKQKKPTNK